MRCETCGKEGGELKAAILLDGKLNCGKCMKCWGCGSELGFGGITRVNGNWMHTNCVTCSCGYVMTENTSVLVKRGVRACLACSGCECGDDECQNVDNFIGVSKCRIVVTKDHELLLDMHRPCVDCGEWCLQTIGENGFGGRGEPRCDGCHKKDRKKRKEMFDVEFEVKKKMKRT